MAAQMAALEQAEAGLVAASGMAAIAAGVLAVVKAGDHIVALDTLYGGTLELFTRELPRMGVSVSMVPVGKPEAWAAAVKPGVTKMFYCEPITNPLIDVPDLEAIVALAKRHSLVTMIDSTFATPVNFNPVTIGFDLVAHSATKYLNGHSDLNAGVLVGRRSLIDAATKSLKTWGGSMDPHAVFLLARGVKTLALRVAQQNRSAMMIAEALEKHPKIARVRYPGLASHPDHARAKRLFRGFGGMMAIELRGGAAEADAFLSRLRIATPATSLGGVETVLSRPAAASHVGLSAAERAALGITDGMIRVSVGIEDVEDLVGDFAAALG